MTRNIIKALIATSLTLLVGCAAQQQGTKIGRAGWFRWETSAGGNGHSYKAVAVTNGLTWMQADELARAEGGYLATITSEAENAFVFNLIKPPTFFAAGAIGPYLGGFQQDRAPEPDGGWCWVSGEPWNYANWHPGSPDNSGGIEDRLAFYSDVSSAPTPTWSDVSRSHVSDRGYIIERDK